MKTTRKQAIWGAAKAVAAVSLLPLAMHVHALEYQLSEDVKVDIDTTLTYGRMWRVEGRSQDLLEGDMDAYTARNAPYGPGTPEFKDYVQRVNSDDGDRNFDKGDVVSSRTAAIADLDVSYKNVGFFLRPQVYYDDVPYGHTHWSDKYNNTVGGYYETNNGFLGGDTADHSHFTDDYRDTLGYKARFLDAYVYGSFAIGDKNLQLRIGRQVISWGEALMLQGGIAFAQNRFDASASSAPGVELKEIFLPTGAVYGQMNVSENDTVEAYWQYEWLPSTLFPTGSYFSMQDMIDGNTFITAPGPGGNIMTRNEYTPDYNNQWGLAFRHLLGEGTEAALYIVNYTDKSPAFWAANTAAKESSGTSSSDPGYWVDPLQYSTNYFDNIRMYGLTLNTVVNGVQVGIEYAYRANAPVVPACKADDIVVGHCKDPSWAQAWQKSGLNNPGTGGGQASYIESSLFSWPDRAEIHTLNIGGTYIFQPTPMWDTATLVGELGGWYIGGFENNDLQFAHLGAFTKYGEGMSMQFMPEYKNVLEGVDVTIPFFMNYGIDGSESYFNYNEHNLWWSVGAEAVYLEHWRFATYYNNYSGQNNLYKDRDNVSLNVKYIF